MKRDEFQRRRTEIISEMLDNPNDLGIYPTSKCYMELDKLYDDIVVDQKLSSENRTPLIIGGQDKEGGIISELFTTICIFITFSIVFFSRTDQQLKAIQSFIDARDWVVLAMLVIGFLAISYVVEKTLTLFYWLIKTPIVAIWKKRGVKSDIVTPVVSKTSPIQPTPIGIEVRAIFKGAVIARGTGERTGDVALGATGDFLPGKV